MMIPKVLLELIDKYNEKGVFVINELKILNWFNGKRWENFNIINCDECVRYRENLYLFLNNDWYRFNGKLIKTKNSCLLNQIITINPKRLIRIQINNIWHTYIFSKRKIEHFNGFKWEKNEKISYEIKNNDVGIYHYSLTRDSFDSWKFKNKTSQEIHGILFCYFQTSYYAINKQNGNLLLLNWETVPVGWSDLEPNSQMSHGIGKSTSWF